MQPSAAHLAPQLSVDPGEGRPPVPAPPGGGHVTPVHVGGDLQAGQTEREGHCCLGWAGSWGPGRLRDRHLSRVTSQVPVGDIVDSPQPEDALGGIGQLPMLREIGLVKSRWWGWT